VSNFLAIATVTETLRRTLSATVGTDVPGATVTAARPDGTAQGLPLVGVNIYLYQVTPNAALRNTDLPTRRAEGSLAQRPRVALDLHYLLTFYGDESVLEPQLCLGSTARTLHARSVLTRESIADAVINTNFIANSNLADEVEMVKFTPGLLSLEELSKLWSVLLQTRYNLSVAYQASVVLIDEDVAPRRHLPVRKRNIRVLPFRQPTIERITSVGDERILVGATLIIEGRNLRGEATKLRVGRSRRGVVLAPQQVDDTRISLPLREGPNLFPAGSLRAGVNALQVIHDLNFGTPGDPHRGFESNVEAFVLRPSVLRDDSGNYRIRTHFIRPDINNTKQGIVSVAVRPNVGPRQRVVLLLNGFRAGTGGPHSYSFDAAARDADRNRVLFRIRRVSPGGYLVRIQVDGAESPLEIDPNPDPTRPTFEQYIEPTVTILR
jgi:hypothetical protein